VEVDDPYVQDTLFLGRTRQVLIFPRLQEGGFFDVVMYVFPNCLPIKMRRMEDSPIVFFPDLPEDETRKKFPDVVEDRRMKR
jgi:hypothetical protein